METAKEHIIRLVARYIADKHKEKKWIPGKDWVQYAGPYFDHNEYVNAVGTLLDEWLILGKDAMEFEIRFPPLLGKKYGVVVNSGSSANLLMMAAMVSRKINASNHKPRVIVPVAGFPTTLNPILQLGAIPDFVDIELDTLNLDLNQVEDKLKRHYMVAMPTDIITFAHVLGNPPNMDRVIQLCRRYGLTLLEDCCDALGSTYDEKPLGSFGRFATCSFFPAHHTSMGEGGFVACDNEEDEKIVRSLRDWGRDCYCTGKNANLSDKGTCGCRFKNWLPTLPDEIFDHKYVYGEIGYNMKPIEMQCSIGLAQLDKLNEIYARRHNNHARLTEIFRPYEEYFHFHKATPKSNPSWFAFPLTVRDGAPFKRSQFTRYLEANKIQTRNYFGGNLLFQPAYRHLDVNCNAHARFPVATKVTKDTFFLGVSPVITKEQLNYVEEKVNDFFIKHLWQK